MTTLLALPPPTEADARLAATVAAQAPRLRAFVRRRVADLADVEDIVQDAFLALISADRLAEPVRHVAAWLKRVARNRIVDRFRQSARNDQLFEPDVGSLAWQDTLPARAPDAARPDSSYERDRLAESLIQALEELSADQREVFVAHELDGRSFKEIASETGIPINTLLSRKHAAVLHLRRRLRDFDFPPVD